LPAPQRSVPCHFPLFRPITPTLSLGAVRSGRRPSLPIRALPVRALPIRPVGPVTAVAARHEAHDGPPPPPWDRLVGRDEDPPPEERLRATALLRRRAAEVPLGHLALRGLHQVT